jgi:hypothetical protein
MTDHYQLMMYEYQNLRLNEDETTCMNFLKLGDQNCVFCKIGRLKLRKTK